jgi:undecaprenyl phosphate-alpha-L-ara4FN deformylase
MRLGLRVDVCTYDGLRLGVPNLLRLFERRKVAASFFVALGPDTSGRAVLQIFRPGFLAKMRRTQAVRTYGLRTILSGTVLPARWPHPALAETLRHIVSAGHELAVHGYDHRRWQDQIGHLDDTEVRQEVESAAVVYRELTGRMPAGFGAPGWQCSLASLRAVDAIGFAYASDTRGQQPFFGRMAGTTFRTLQLPTAFPTLDEVLGVNEMDGEAFVAAIRGKLAGARGRVLTLHAEMEGRRYLGLANQSLEALAADGVTWCPLARIAEDALASDHREIPVLEIVQRSIPGRAETMATADEG